MKRAKPLEERLSRHLTALQEPFAPLAGRIPLTQVQELDTGVWVATAGVAYHHLACALSTLEGGMWIAAPQSLTWVNGRQACWLIDWRTWEAVRTAREACLKLGAPVRSYTLGGCARALLKWCGIQEKHWQCSQDALGGVPWAYHLVTPGTYRDMRLTDLTAAYHQVVERLPSPRLVWTADGPLWAPLVGQERERWSTLLSVAQGHKGLRTRLLGCMIGGGKGAVTYHRGQVLQNRPVPGPLVTAGLLVARTVYELCGLQAQEAGTVYANTDCVLTPAGAGRAVWDRYGYRYRTDAEGDAELVSLGVYRVGDKQTAWYGAGGRFPVPYPADPLPTPLTLTAWH